MSDEVSHAGSWTDVMTKKATERETERERERDLKSLMKVVGLM